jgi:hypothetical protein
VLELGTGVRDCLTLEVSTIFLLHAYQYGHFLIIFGPVPLAVAVGWSIILYSAMATASVLALPSWAAPALVGLLGLTIDLSMDAVAIRVHMWQWHGIASTQQWFGVPYANFYARVIVAPLSFHLYFLILLCIAQIVAHLPALLAISLSMLVLSLVVHGALVVSVLGTLPTPPSSPLASHEPLHVQ